MIFLDNIPSTVFDLVGSIVGLTTCTVVLIQLIKEIGAKKASTLSPANVIGWFFIFSFWFVYGIRFDMIALWLTNSIALILQLGLIVTVLTKRKKYSE